MAKAEGYLTVFYTFEVEGDDVTPTTAEEILEAAYRDGELGVLDDHEFTRITVDGKVIVDTTGGGTDG